MAEPTSALNPTSSSETSTQLQKPSQNLKALTLELGRMGALRQGEWTKGYLQVFAAELSTHDPQVVAEALSRISQRPRRDGESALPDYGTILREINALTHPLRHLRELVNRMSMIYRLQPAEEELLAAFEERCGYRTDADLDKGYMRITSNDAIHKMPTPADFIAHCPPMRERRTA